MTCTEAPTRAATLPTHDNPTGGDETSAVGIGVLLACAFMPIVDFFIVNVALPTISAGLHPSQPSLELVVSGYGALCAALLVVGGRIGDMVGRRRALMGGLAGFTAASALCALSPSIDVLIVARGLQAASAAILTPQVLGTFRASLSEQRRGRAIGLYGAVAGSATVVGQVAGGLLVNADIFGTTWRPIFMVNVPIGIVLLLVLRRVVPETRSEHPTSIDRLGTVLFALTLLGVLIPLTEGRSVGWAPWVWVTLGVAALLAVLTVIVERRGEAGGGTPLLPPSLLRLRSVRLGLLLGPPFFMTFGAFMFAFALTMQEGLHLSPLDSGLAIVPFALPFLVGSIATSRLLDRFGRGALAGGALVQAVGLAVLAVTVASGWPHVSAWSLIPGLAIAGLGEAPVYASLFRLVLGDVPAHQAGVGGGVMTTMQQSALALGVAVLGTIFFAFAGTGTAHMGSAFAVVAAVGAASGVLLLVGARALPAAGRPAPSNRGA